MRIFAPIVVALAGTAVIAAEAGATGLEGIDAISADVLPHINNYVACGKTHFAALGSVETAPFEKVEITVAAECGHYISATREVLTRHGYRRRAVQNAYINELYRTIAPHFRDAYAAGKLTQLARAPTRKLNELWSNCLLDFSGAAALAGDEPPAAILRRALSHCADQEQTLLAAMMAPGGEVAAYVRETLFDEIRQDNAAAVMALVAKLRAGPSPPERPDRAV